MNTDFLPIIPVVLPLAVAPFCLLIKHSMFCWWLTVVVMLVSCITSFFTLGQLNTQNEMTYPLEGGMLLLELNILSITKWSLLFFISSIGLLFTLLYSGSLRWDFRKSLDTIFFFYTAFLLTFAGLAGVIATATHLMHLYLLKFLQVRIFSSP